MANMCAGVTSTYMEFTLTFWNLKMHFSFLSAILNLSNPKKNICSVFLCCQYKSFLSLFQV